MKPRLRDSYSKDNKTSAVTTQIAGSGMRNVGPRDTKFTPSGATLGEACSSSNGYFQLSQPRVERCFLSLCTNRLYSTNAITPSGRGTYFGLNTHWLTTVSFRKVAAKVPRDEPRELGLELRLVVHELA